MKKIIPILFMLLILTGAAWPQEAFDALRRGDMAAVRSMIEKSPQIVDAQDGSGNTLLHLAAAEGRVEWISFLIERGAKLELRNARQKTPLHLAAMNDRTDAVTALLQKGAVLDARDDYQRTALILCARELGQAATGRVLIEAGADVNATDKFSSTALKLAAWRGKGEFVDLLLEKGARIPEGGEKWQALLSEAASHGLTTLFRRLTGGRQDLKAVDPEGRWLLQTAAAGGSAEIVGMLLDKGFSPGLADRFGWTPLHYAARDGRTDAARILVERSAPMNTRTIMGQTAYNIAGERGMTAVATLLAEKGADRSDARFPILEGDYLGQPPPPTDKAVSFAPGIISSIWGLHSTAVFSPDGNEVYWAPMMTFPGEIYSRGGLLMMKRVEGRWLAPCWAPFSGPDHDDDVPFFSADGNRIYFISRRPLPGETESGGEKIWFADRTPGGWSEPRPLDPRVNARAMHWEFSLDRERNLYFAGQGPDSLGMGDIYVARFSDGKYESPVNLGAPVNSTVGENSPFIASDGSYLLFERQFDIWVSFRDAHGAWSEPVQLGPEVNSPSIEICPVVTTDGKYLFFLSQRDGQSHAYWARAEVIEKARPHPPLPDSAADCGYSVIFYSGRNGNDDIYILHPGQKEPVNLTRHPAKDQCPAASPDGRKIVFLSDRSGNFDIFLMNRDGSGLTQFTATPENEEHPEFSPDGKKILFVKDFGEKTEIWIMGADGSNPQRLTSGTWRDVRPFLSPDGSKILFMSTRDGNYEIYTMAADGSDQKRITRTPEWEIFPAWSPDGKQIAYSQKYRADGQMQGMIRVMNADGSGDRAVTAVETRDENAMWSPDGHFIVFQSVRDGNFEVYRVNADGSHPVRLTDDPAWDGWASFVPRPEGDSDFPRLTGLYLGQKPPGRTPEVFAPGIVSTEAHEFAGSFTSDGKEYYFTRREAPGSPTLIMVTKCIDGVWTKPEPAPFNDTSHRPDAMSFEPMVTPDESYLIYSSVRPGGTIDQILMVSFRNPDGSWGEPRPLDLGMRAGTPYLSPDGKYLFFSGGERGKGDIYWVSAEVIGRQEPFR
jgi:Tol biopolymer transport system component/ankyrin repeat protein